VGNGLTLQARFNGVPMSLPTNALCLLASAHTAFEALGRKVLIAFCATASCRHHPQQKVFKLGVGGGRDLMAVLRTRTLTDVGNAI